MMAVSKRQTPEPVWLRGWKDAAARTGGILGVDALRKLHRRRGIPGVHRLGDGARPRILIDQAAFDRWWSRWRRLLRST